jgi:DNA-directed RNA polymerase specialized sigma24 family protein
MLRFYAGLSPEEVAEQLGTSPRTVYRQWAYARAWLYRELKREREPNGARADAPPSP